MTIGQAFLREVAENQDIRRMIKENPKLRDNYYAMFGFGFEVGYKEACDDIKQLPIRRENK